MTIVCATHFTDSSSGAVSVAAHLAKRTGQPLWLVCVLPGIALGPGAGPREKIVSDALHLEAGLLREQGVVVEVALLHGKVERAVGRLCNDVGAKLLVVGDPHARSPLFATPVDRIASGVSVPLLVVRDKRPFQAWAKGERPLKVLLAIDHTWSSALAREWLGGLAAYGPLDVLATHVWTPAEEHARRGRAPPMTESDVTSLEALLTKDAEAALAELPPNVTSRVRLEIGQGHVGELLLALAAREQVDIMVLGTHPQKGLLSRLRSISHEVVADALMSVALVPGEGQAVEAMARASPASARGLKERSRRSL